MYVHWIIDTIAKDGPQVSLPIKDRNIGICLTRQSEPGDGYILVKTCQKYIESGSRSLLIIYFPARFVLLD